jgi:hypothetical protein
MSVPNDGDYEFVEVKVGHKIDIRLSLDDLLAMMQAEVDSKQAAAQQVSSDVQNQLNQLNQLATELKGRLPK